MNEDELQRALDVHAAKLRNERQISPEEVLRYELRVIESRYANAIRLISNFVGLLPPPPVTAPDGRVFQFEAPNPNDMLRRLRDAVDRMRDELQAPPAAGYNALALREGIKHVLTQETVHVAGHVYEDLQRLLEGTCRQP